MMTSSSLLQNDINSMMSKKDKKLCKKKSKNNAAAVTMLLTTKPLRSQSLMARGWARIYRRGKRESANDILSEPKNGATNLSVSADLLRREVCVLSASTANFAVTQQFIDLHNERRNIVTRGMEKLRQSFRKSFRRTKGQVLTASSSGGCDGDLFARTSSADAVETVASGARNGKTYCQPDEAAVRSAVCSFQVKYLGAVEIFHSRGMQVCEDALNILRARKRQTKAILYVTGDSIRVVDQESNRGLIVDQTIEKVSFCAPDRQNEKGFAYICREAASKRWMCHGFHSVKEPGERLSHAVGCAFTVCLEKKKIRDAEDAAYSSGRVMAVVPNLSISKFTTTMETASPLNRSNSSLKETVYDNSATFRRQLSIAERRLDPQTAIIVKNNPNMVAASSIAITPRSQSDMIAADASDAYSAQAATSMSLSVTQPLSTQSSDNSVTVSLQSDTLSTVKPRPVANPSLFERQGSFKAPVQSANSNAFKRFNSLRSDLIGPTGANRFACIKTLHNEPIYEGEDEALSVELCSLNFALPVGALSSARHANPNATLPHISTSQSFGGNVSLPAEFTEEFVRNNEKRASRADVWLTQILQTSTANEKHSNAAISFTSSQQQYGPASCVANTTGYNNSVTEITPLNSFINNIPHSQSADCFSMKSLQHGGLATNVQSDLYHRASTTGLSGPPPNQPPPPLPPSFTSTLNGHLPNKSLSLTATSMSVRNDKDDSHSFIQNIIKSPYRYDFDVEKKNNYSNENEPVVIPRMSKVSSAQRGNMEGLLKTDTISPAATVAASGHARKSSAARMSIEYELLEETDAPPQSPPRVDSPAVIEKDKQVFRLLQITSSDQREKDAEIDSFGQCVFNASSASAAVASTSITTQSAPNGRLNDVSAFTTTLESSPPRETTTPTGTASAEAAIRAIRLATISSLQSAESAISALHNSSKSDDPFDVKWSAEVLQKSTLRKSSIGQCAGSGRIDRHSSIAANNY